ncbi:MAG: hypothetical protein WD696_01975 [Bryobacteraceae bacterium]
MRTPLHTLIRITLVGALAMVVWGMVFWGLLAGPIGVFRQLPDAPAVTQALTGSQTQTGTYFMPWPRDTAETSQRFLEQHRLGPFFRLSYVREGVDPQSPRKLLLGVVHDLSVALIAALLLWVANPASRLRSFAIVFLAGLLGSNFHMVGDPVWFHMPWDYSMGVLFYDVVSWGLLGLTGSLLWRPLPKR